MLTRRQALSTGATLLATALPSPLLAASGRRRTRRVSVRDGRVRLADGRCLSYREYGDNPHAPLVIYFHGTPGSRLELAICDDDECFSATRVVAVDRPGMGCSTFYKNRCITHWPRDVLQLVHALGSGDAPFGIIGLSGGAPYAAVCACQIPDRLTHVAIVSGHAPLDACGTCPGSQDALIRLISRRPRLGKLGINLVGRRLDRKPDKVIQQISKNWSASDRKLMLCNSENYCALIANLQEARRCGSAGPAQDIELLGRCWGFCVNQISGVPVSIWQGGCDPVATPSMGRYFHRRIAGSEFILDPRAGHVTMFKWHAREIMTRFLM